jgi:outer membrane protein assembly factor BamE
MVMCRIFFSLLVVLSLLSVSCSSAIPSFKPYKMDIQQGNVVTSKMMLQLRPGMSKSQVRFIMGTPLIQDPFHSNRWDYFYEMRKGGKVVEQRHVILDFEKEALVRVRGDVVPAGEGDDNARPTTGTEPVSQPDPEKKGLMDKLQFWNKDKKAPTTPEAAPANLVSPGTQKPAAQQPVAKEPAPAKEVPSVIAVPPVVAPEPEVPAPAAKPEPAPAPESAPVAEPVKSEPAPAIESKPEAKPMAAPEPEPTPAPVVEPVKPEPVKVEEPAPVAKPEPIPEPAPQKRIEAPVEQPAPAVQPEPEPIAEPAAKPAEKAPEKPVEKPAEKPEVKAQPQAETKPTPTPAKEPEEDEPGYFEYMLEKIGF